jgi:ubiquinone/menaquinone biosynthesis C-methylase UbiE
MANPEYWEREWRAEFNTYYQLKIEKIIDTIPSDVNSVIDIGCGNGVITNELAEKFDITGVDRSQKALNAVQTKKIRASCDHIELPDMSFDLVFSSEMLEHLEHDLFKGAIHEMKRLTKKYIFITVPNDENINKYLVECPNCKQIFNKTYHLRRINLDVITTEFPEYKVIDHFTFGKKMRDYHPLLEKIKHEFSPPHAWIPNLWTPDGYRNTLCPKCATEFEIPYKFHAIGFFCDIINTIISPKKRHQLFVLLEKIN